MKIAVIGAGYVGAALAVLLSQSHEVAVLDIDATRVECLNQRRPPIEDDDLAEFVELQKTFADSPKSWSVDASGIDQTTFDLSVKNPNGGGEIAHRSPQEIMDEIAALDAESAEVLGNIKALL